MNARSTQTAAPTIHDTIAQLALGWSVLTSGGMAATFIAIVINGIKVA